MIWIRISSMRKPRREVAAWRKDDRITSAVCLSCWLFEPLNQGKVYEKPVAGVSNSLFLLRFSYYKSAVRNKCFTCDLILCRHKHLGSTLRLGSLRCLESSRDLINLSCCKRKGVHMLSGHHSLFWQSRCGCWKKTWTPRRSLGQNLEGWQGAAD